MDEKLMVIYWLYVEYNVLEYTLNEWDFLIHIETMGLRENLYTYWWLEESGPSGFQVPVNVIREGELIAYCVRVWV